MYVSSVQTSWNQKYTEVSTYLVTVKRIRTMEIFKADKFRTVSIKSTVFNFSKKTVFLIEKKVRERSNVRYA